MGTAAALVLALPAAAGAATVSITGSTLSFSAAGGEENDLTIETDGSIFRVIDGNAPVTAGTGCTQRAVQRVHCPTVGITRIEALTRDQDDVVTLFTGTVDATLNGGPGGDTLTSEAGDDTLIAGRSDPSGSFEQLASGAGQDTLTSSTGPGFTSSNLSAGPGNDDLIGGPGFDTLFGDTGADDIQGGDSFDSTFWSGVAPVTVTLGAGANDGEAGEGDNVHADVEQIIGTPFGDTLTGTVGDQDLSGDAGPDTIDAGPGNDALGGGPGVDTLTAGDGIDSLQGGTEADDMSGGAGTDEASYDVFGSAAVTVTMNNVANDGQAGGTEGDNVRTDIENLRGSPASDTLTGSTGDNVIVGVGGDDSIMGIGGDDDLFGDFTFNSGTFGADTVNGGNGDDNIAGGGGGDGLIGGNDFDLVDYSNFAGSNPVTVTTGNNVADDGLAGEGDNISSSVEGLVGGNGNDTISGASGPNVLRGGLGTDTLIGANGNDVLLGDRCCTFFADVLNGGDGNDTASYRSHFLAVTVDIDGVADDGSSGGTEGDNVQTNVENVIGGSSGDTITGNNANNTLSGLGSSDNLIGAGGGDTLTGGNSNDTLEGQAGKDELYSRDQFATDTVNCGTESDTAVADSFDSVNADCELVLP
jgi:Ca2+-binding RTX toxin-like protein